MKAMFIGFATAIVIAIVAGVVMSSFGPGTAERETPANVRL